MQAGRQGVPAIVHKVMRKNQKKRGFVVCVKNKGYVASLELRKIYQTVPDPDLERRHLARVVDESGEDYLYPVNFFVPIELPKALEKVVLAAA